MVLAKKFTVSGDVQGVGFRFSTKLEADALNITGYVKNLDNGNVEIAAYGKEEDIQLLEEWLNTEGPPFASINNILVEELNMNEIPKRFTLF